MAVTSINAKPASRRGPQQRVTPEQVLDAALSVIDSDGLEGFTVRAVTAALGMSPMSLYTYFENKDVLLDETVARALASAVPVLDHRVSWREQLRDAMLGLYGAFVAHPGAVELIMTRRTPGLSLDPIREPVLDILLRAGLDEASSVDAFAQLMSHALGAAIVQFRQANDPAAEEARLRALPASAYPRLQQTAGNYVQRGTTASYPVWLGGLISLIDPKRDDHP